MSVLSRRASDFDEPHRVGRVAGADDEQHVDLVEQLLHRALPVRRRITDVLTRWPLDLREAPAEHGDDLARLVHRERGLCDVRDARSGQRDALSVVDGLDEHDRIRRLAGRALDLLVPGMADEHDAVALLGVAARLRVDLRDERAGCVDRGQPPPRRRVPYRGRDAVRGEDDRRPLGHLVHRVDEDGAARLQLPHDMGVVDDLLPDVDGGPVERERAPDGLDGPLDTGAIPPRRGQKDPLHQTGGRVAPFR